LNREESRKNELEGWICELSFKNYYLSSFAKEEAKHIKHFLTKIKIDSPKGRILNLEGIEEILGGFEEKEKIMKIIKELEHKELPDFLVKVEKKEECGFWFVEVKKMPKKFKFSSINNKKAIKTLAENGFIVMIALLKVPVNREELKKKHEEYKKKNPDAYDFKGGGKVLKKLGLIILIIVVILMFIWFVF